MATALWQKTRPKKVQHRPTKTTLLAIVLRIFVRVVGVVPFFLYANISNIALHVALESLAVEW